MRSKLIGSFSTAMLLLLNTELAGADEPRMVIPEGKEGAAFETIFVEGEDLVHVKFERPVLDLQFEALHGVLFESQGVHAMLSGRPLDLTKPLLQHSTLEPSPYLARPWLQQLRAGAVARFRPAMEGVARWNLTVANSRGETVATFSGEGKPPAEIAWDGRMQNGEFAAPGFTYSYVFEAFDRAGNKRNFVGEGFELPQYRAETDHGLVMMFSGEAAIPAGQARKTSEPPPVLLLEAASWINQKAIDAPISVRTTARSFNQAQSLAQAVSSQLRPLVLGNPARLQEQTQVVVDAPASGTVAIQVGL